MSASANLVANHSNPQQLQAVFVHLLARIETHARIVFRHLKCPHRLADAVQETIAICWKWFLRATRQGKDVSSFVSVLANYATRAVRSGRRLCAQEKANDVLSPRAQQLKHFTVQTLPAHESGADDNSTLDALTDNTRTSPGDQAAFRIDFPAWLKRLGDRNRRIASDMALGERTKDLADRYGTTQGRISQLRRAFHDDWFAFCAAPADDDARKTHTSTR